MCEDILCLSYVTYKYVLLAKLEKCVRVAKYQIRAVGLHEPWRVPACFFLIRDEEGDDVVVRW